FRRRSSGPRPAELSADPRSRVGRWARGLPKPWVRATAAGATPSDRRHRQPPTGEFAGPVRRPLWAASPAPTLRSAPPSERLRKAPLAERDVWEIFLDYGGNKS